MAVVTQPLRDEHKELLPHIETLRQLGDSVGDVPVKSLKEGLDEAVAFLTHHLIPHAQAEEAALYPAVNRVIGAKEATSTMSRDHLEVGRLTEELISLTGQVSGATIFEAQAKALRRLLYGLYALVKTHFAKEEEIYLPLLDQRLSKEEAAKMFEELEKAAEEAKAHAGHHS